MTHQCPTCRALCACTGHTAEIGPAPPACLCCTVCVACGELKGECTCPRKKLVPWTPPEPEPQRPGICPLCGEPHMVGVAMRQHMGTAHGTEARRAE